MFPIGKDPKAGKVLWENNINIKNNNKMETLTYQMRYAVLHIARRNKKKAKSRIQSFLQIAYKTLQEDELEEFIRDVVVLKKDIIHLLEVDKS